MMYLLVPHMALAVFNSLGEKEGRKEGEREGEKRYARHNQRRHNLYQDYAQSAWKSFQRSSGIL